MAKSLDGPWTVGGVLLSIAKPVPCGSPAIWSKYPPKRGKQRVNRALLFFIVKVCYDRMLQLLPTIGVMAALAWMESRSGLSRREPASI